MPLIMKKITSIIVLFFYLFGFFAPIANASRVIDEELIKEAQASVQDLSAYGKWFDIETWDQYIDAPENAFQSYSDYVSEIVASRMTDMEVIEYIVEIDNSLNCGAHVCTKITYLDKFEHTAHEVIDWHVNVVDVDPPEYDYESTIYPPTSYYPDTGSNAPSESNLNQFNELKDSLNNKNLQLKHANDRLEDALDNLDDAKSAHSKAEKELARLESQHNAFVKAANEFGSQAEEASKEAELAKQELSDETTELERLEQSQSEHELTESKIKSELAALEAELKQLAADKAQNFILDYTAANSEIEFNTISMEEALALGFSEHNDGISILVESSEIGLALDDIDVDYAELISSEIPGISIDNLVGYERSFSESSALHNDIVDAIRYQQVVSESVQQNGSLDQQDLAFIGGFGIELALDLTLENELVVARDVLNNSLSILDTALDFVPGVSFVKDVASIVTGTNPLTGEEFTETERAILLGTLFVPAALVGTAKIISKAVKIFKDFGQHGGHWQQRAHEIESVIKKSDDNLSDYSTLCPEGVSCDGGEKTEDILSRFTGKKSAALADTKPGEYFEGVESTWGKSVFRSNMKKLYDRLDLPSDVHAHHIFPKEFETQFKEAGLWVHDPRLMAPVPDGLHTQVHSSGYNAEWAEFLETGPDYDEVIEKAREMVIEYGYDHVLGGYF